MSTPKTTRIKGKLPTGVRYDDSTPTCQYRYCAKPIPLKRSRYPSKYCCDECGRLERKCQKGDDRKKELSKRELHAAQFHKDHPNFYAVMNKMASTDLETLQSVNFRGLWEDTKRITKLKIDNNCMTWFKRELEKDIQKIYPNFSFRWRRS